MGSKLSTLAAVFGLASLANLASAQAPFYHVQFLPATDLAGNTVAYQASAFNNLGQTVAVDPSNNVFLVNPNGTFQFIGASTNPNPSLFHTELLGVNDLGLAVGVDYPNIAATFGPAGHPESQLPLFSNQGGNQVPFNIAYAVNNAGAIVGVCYGYFSGQEVPHAALWVSGAISDLGELPGDNYSTADAVNASGVAVGESGVPFTQNDEAAMFMGNGTVIDLGSLPGAQSSDALAINSSNVAVGFAMFANGTQHALRFAIGGPPTDLAPGNDYAAATGINDAGTITLGFHTLSGPSDGAVIYQGTTYDLASVSDQPTTSFMPIAINNAGQIFARVSVPPFNTFAVLSPVSTNPAITVTVKQRVDGGTVPDGTNVALLNNNGTALSYPVVGTTVAGVVNFTTFPNPTAPNTSYEVVVLPPVGAKGLPSVTHNITAGSTTVYITNVVASISQSIDSAPPVAFASCKIGSVSAYTGFSGTSPAIWLPDGTYSVTFAENPGVPCSTHLTLGPSSSANLVPELGFAEIKAHLTRVFLTARYANGKTYIPKTGIWSISPGGISSPVNGQVISQGWWLPNGTYTGTLSGATANGSSLFTVGTPLTVSGLRTITVAP